MMLVSTANQKGIGMTKDYAVSEDILRRAENKITRSFGQDSGLFYYKKKKTVNFDYAEACLKHLIEQLEWLISSGVTEENAKQQVFSRYNDDAIHRGVSQKNRELMREALDIVVKEAKEKKPDPAETRRHREVGLWYQQGSAA